MAAIIVIATFALPKRVIADCCRWLHLPVDNAFQSVNRARGNEVTTSIDWSRSLSLSCLFGHAFYPRILGHARCATLRDTLARVLAPMPPAIYVSVLFPLSIWLKPRRVKQFWKQVSHLRIFTSSTLFLLSLFQTPLFFPGQWYRRRFRAWNRTLWSRIWTNVLPITPRLKCMIK